MEFEMHDVVI